LPRIGITGHMDLAPSSVPLVDRAIRIALSPFAPQDLVGISCIAAGADTIFAEAVLDAGGQLEIILPAADYRERRVRPENANRFDGLVRRASKLTVLDYPASNRDAYEAANEAVLNTCDTLFAVWDGKAPADKGGTASVIDSARRRELPVVIIWPDGASRE
jgi:hypothetical protein